MSHIICTRFSPTERGEGGFHNYPLCVCIYVCVFYVLYVHADPSLIHACVQSCSWVKAHLDRANDLIQNDAVLSSTCDKYLRSFIMNEITDCNRWRITETREKNVIIKRHLKGIHKGRVLVIFYSLGILSRYKKGFFFFQHFLHAGI